MMDRGAIALLHLSRTRLGGREREDVLDPGICWRAINSRDPRFDGQFFAGATTTGLYCRNICPVPSAKAENLRLFVCAAAAEAAGFRPCKRCQPQAALGTPAWLGTSAVVSRAFRLIMEGALNDGGVEDLAERLGLGARQLRRLFVQHLGVSPLKIAITHRIHMARKLIDETRLPMTQIAFGSGFKSIRDFNYAMRISMGQSPSKLRRATRSQSNTGSGGLELRLSYRRPFDWAGLVSFLRPRLVPGVEFVTNDCYQRTIEIAGSPGFLTVRPDHAESRLVVHLQTSRYDGLAQTVERVRRLFDLSADPIQIANHLSSEPRLRRLIMLRPGLRVPGVWDGFEAGVLAVLGQSLTASGPKRLVARIVRKFGTPVDSPIRGLKYLFPRPEDLVNADLVGAGVSDGPAQTIRKLASSAISKHLSFATWRTLEQAVLQMEQIVGVDECTAHYIAMRAFGEPDAFPSKELGLRRSLAGTQSIPTPAEACALAERWRPWRAYAAMHLSNKVEADASCGSGV
jgi:AraC family transcriptional regulator of adaptative response / DNA-3-methyladenine glycosylase II